MISADPTIEEFLASDYGGNFVENGTVYDAVDNGQNAGGYSTPGWLSSLSGVFGTAMTAAGVVAPLINGKPATSPGNPAQKPNASGTVPTKSTFPSWLIWAGLAGVGVLVALVLVFRK